MAVLKNTPRLDYERLADALVDRGLLSREAAKLVLQQVAASDALFPEILVTEGLVSDWEVARVVSEVFNLPFLPVEITPPNEKLLKDLDHAFLRKHALVPVERFGDVLTVVMPGLVPTAILNDLTGESEVVLPVVGLVTSNRAWLAKNAPATEEAEAILPLADTLEADDTWANIFDAGDEAVQLGLELDDDTSALSPPPPPPHDVPAPPPAMPRPKNVPGDVRRKIVLDENDFG